MESTFGRKMKVTVFGGSHEPEIGVKIEGLPAEALDFDGERLQAFLDLRAPGNGPLATKRKEPDRFIVTDTEICETGGIRAGAVRAVIRNTDQKSGDYKKLADVPRPGHADLAARYRYGEELNMAGGGPFSGRMTAPLCIAGGIALQYLEKQGVRIGAHILKVGDAEDRPFDPVAPETERVKGLVPGQIAVLDEDAAERMAAVILAAKDEGDSIGAIIEVAASGVPKGAGGAMYDGIESVLSPIYFGIPAVKAVEFGAGTKVAGMKGSENNDAYSITNGEVSQKTNNAGGVLGGITTGMPVIARLSFKPTPSIAKVQESVNLKEMKNEQLEIGGRHDPCVAVRAVPAVIAATAAGLLDAMILSGIIE